MVLSLLDDWVPLPYIYIYIYIYYQGSGARNNALFLGEIVDAVPSWNTQDKYFMGFDDGNIIYLKIFRNDFLKFIFNINA